MTIEELQNSIYNTINTELEAYGIPLSMPPFAYDNMKNNITETIMTEINQYINENYAVPEPPVTPEPPITPEPPVTPELPIKPVEEVTPFVDNSYMLNFLQQQQQFIYNMLGIK